MCHKLHAKCRGFLGFTEATPLQGSLCSRMLIFLNEAEHHVVAPFKQDLWKYCVVSKKIFSVTNKFCNLLRRKSLNSVQPYPNAQLFVVNAERIALYSKAKRQTLSTI
jgi:hypothetical protein